MKTTIRILLEIVLLVSVWQNSHWSVALSLSLLFAAQELHLLLLREALRSPEQKRREAARQAVFRAMHRATEEARKEREK
jgi:hypothetical protein